MEELQFQRFRPEYDRFVDKNTDRVEASKSTQEKHATAGHEQEQPRSRLFREELCRNGDGIRAPAPSAAAPAASATTLNLPLRDQWHQTRPRVSHLVVLCPWNITENMVQVRLVEATQQGTHNRRLRLVPHPSLTLANFSMDMKPMSSM